MPNDDRTYEEVCQQQIAELEEENERIAKDKNRLLQIQGWLKSRNDELERIASSYKAIITIDKHLFDLGYKREG